MLERTVEAGSLRIATQSFGPESGDPVVLVMGASASMLWWPDALCTAMADRGYRVIRYDNRDTGRTVAALDYTVEDMAADLFSVMDGHGIDVAHVVGMSLGGYIAQMAALMQPDRVRSLTLIGSEPLGGAGRDLPGIDARFLEHFATLDRLDWSDREAVAGFLLQVARLSAGSGRVFDDEAARARVGAEIDRAVDLRAAFNHAGLTLARDWTGRARDIRQPVLVIHGDEDPILPLPNGQAIAELVPNARLVVLKGTGHELVPADFPAITDALTGHMARA